MVSQYVLLARRIAVVAIALVAPAGAAHSQGTLDSTAFAALRWREIGPFRGGRSVAVSGATSRPFEYYMGTVGGGVFKTDDGGLTWRPSSDSAFGGTVGALAVSASNNDIVWAGGGETHIRGNTSHGEGLWKSTNAGAKWTYMGLRETRHIARIRIHPTNPDIVYVGALGHAFGPNPERGVFKTTDGGRNWNKILFRNDSTGISDLLMDPSNPEVLYASFWHAYRTPWMLNSGGPGGGLFKTMNGGSTWAEITRNPGLPRGLWGKVGLAVSPAKTSRVWAIIEADSGGVFRSDDGGATWERTNDDRNLRQRAWYYSKIYADPKDTNVVYVLNVAFWKSTDGGRTFRTQPTPHSDNHDMWIDPANGQRMVEANDGGANVSINGGRTWTNQAFATAQMYHVSTTNHFPYKVCGAQQDNSTICLPSRAGGGITMMLADFPGGGESGYVTPRPDQPDVFFAGSYGGLLTRKDIATGISRNVTAWPSNPMGHSSEDIKYRFQWTFPIVISQHDPNVLYVGGSHLFKSTNEGESFTLISGPLARNDKRTMGPSGGPITRDQTGVETYGTIFTIAESPRSASIIWVGTDDGYVQLTRDGGKNWTNVTPPAIGDFTRISMIEASRFDPAVAYIAANRYQQDDFSPSLWKTSNYGATWTKIVNGIGAEHFTRVIREDPERRGLLYAGTERSALVSFDDGAHWQSLQLNLPPVPVHDLVIKDGDLVAGTHGRSFWIIDDLSVLRQTNATTLAKAAHLYKPRDTYRIDWSGGGGGEGDEGPSGANPPAGAVVHYWLKNANTPVKLEFVAPDGKVIKTYESATEQPAAATPAGPMQGGGGRGGAGAPARPSNRTGHNTFSWDMRYPDASTFRGMILWAGNTRGPLALPGTYTVRLTAGGETQTQTFRLLADPRSKATAADLAAQFDFLIKIRDRVTAANDAVKTSRWIKYELEERQSKATGALARELQTMGRAFGDSLTSSEGEIYQIQNRSNQDPLNYPIKLNNKIAALNGVVASAPARPTKQSLDVYAELTALLDVQLGRSTATIARDLPRINDLLRRLGLPEIVAKPEDPPVRTIAQ
ncbi:MAG TPA: glycosyl hydrolase [Gemmatimonadaceae bacterium]|nr:glycosyl hydrolase [Gemmatimonadaceae bacterium]